MDLLNKSYQTTRSVSVICRGMWWPESQNCVYVQPRYFVDAAEFRMRSKSNKVHIHKLKSMGVSGSVHCQRDTSSAEHLCWSHLPEWQSCYFMSPFEEYKWTLRQTFAQGKERCYRSQLRWCDKNCFTCGYVIKRPNIRTVNISRQFYIYFVFPYLSDAVMLIHGLLFSIALTYTLTYQSLATIT